MYLLRSVVPTLLLATCAVPAWAGQDVAAPAPASAPAPVSAKLYSPAELVRKIQSGDRVVFLDVREPQEFQVNHIPGALNIPQRDFAARKNEIPEGALVIPYCNMDFRGFQAVEALRKVGIANVGLMQKRGLNGWRDQKLPVVNEKGVTDAAGLATVATVDPSKLSEIAPVTRVAATGEVKRFKMEASEWYFEPNDLKVNAGDRVEIEVTAKKGSHYFVMPDFELDQRLTQGETKTISFIADQRGEFRFGSCEWAGEALQVMKGRIAVE